jgi:hypothetical protein
MKNNWKQLKDILCTSPTMKFKARKPQGKQTQIHKDKTKYTRKEKHRDAI